jgi:hypothetical protein
VVSEQMLSDVEEMLPPFTERATRSKHATSRQTRRRTKGWETLESEHLKPLIRTQEARKKVITTTGAHPAHRDFLFWDVFARQLANSWHHEVPAV